MRSRQASPPRARRCRRRRPRVSVPGGVLEVQGLILGAEEGRPALPGPEVDREDAGLRAGGRLAQVGHGSSDPGRRAGPVTEPARAALEARPPQVQRQVLESQDGARELLRDLEEATEGLLGLGQGGRPRRKEGLAGRLQARRHVLRAGRRGLRAAEAGEVGQVRPHELRQARAADLEQAVAPAGEGAHRPDPPPGVPHQLDAGHVPDAGGARG